MNASASAIPPLAATAGRTADAGPVLHLLKLSVGPRDVAELRDVQTRRLAANPPLRHRTRMYPRRAAELLDGGSIFWVVAGFVQVRQRVLRIDRATREDGVACADLVLDPTLVPVEMRSVKAFQGWRYLESAAAPKDLAHDAPAAEGLEALPAQLRRELRELGLI